MKIFYGTSDISIDVTDICLSKLIKDNIITIPSGDFNRSNYFTDPLFDIEKKIIILNNDKLSEYNVYTQISINIITNTITSTINENEIQPIYYQLLNIINIAILIPSTSKNRNWINIESSYLYKTLNNLKETLDDNYNYNYYIGVDEDDIFYNNDNCDFFKKNYNNVNFLKINSCNKGHLTKIWNILCYEAYNNKNDYYYACGDDIEINMKGWIKECILQLNDNKNIGVSGLQNINGNMKIITQPFVHKTHIDIFGYFYPEEIINWYCDDWINEIYSKNRYIINNIFTSSNNGIEERYNVISNVNLEYYVNRDKLIIENYLLNLNNKYYLFKYTIGSDKTVFFKKWIHLEE